MTTTSFYIQPTRLGQKVTIEDTQNRASASLKSDGTIEDGILDQVSLSNSLARDFQEKIDTVGIRSLLRRLRPYAKATESLDAKKLTDMTRAQLGETWTGKNVGPKNRLRAHLQSKCQSITFECDSHSKGNHRIQLNTWSEDTSGASWLHTVVGYTDQDFKLDPGSINESANIQVPVPVSLRN
jgi:hypothetical protein